MRSICLVLVVLFVNVNAGNVWLKDLISAKGWDLGYGLVLKLNESHKGKNVPPMERLSLDFNFGDLVGVSVAKPRSEGVELDFYVKKDVDYEEGRGKKNGGGSKYIFPMIIGYKAALMISAMFAVMKLLTLKAIFLAKAALIISIYVLFLKLKNHNSQDIIEVEQHGYPSQSVPYYVEKDLGSGSHGYGGGGGGGFGGGYGGIFAHHNYGKEGQPSNVYSDVVYAPSAVGSPAEDLNNAYVSATPNESTIPIDLGRKGQELDRRRDTIFYKKVKGGTGSGSIISIKKS